jgi:hypothetical protein
MLAIVSTPGSRAASLDALHHHLKLAVISARNELICRTPVRVRNPGPAIQLASIRSCLYEFMRVC